MAFLSRLSFNNGSAESRTMPGQPIGSFYGYRVAGLMQSYADVLASPIQSSIGATQPGDFKFQQVAQKDKDEGVVTASSRTIIGIPHLNSAMACTSMYFTSVLIYPLTFKGSMEMLFSGRGARWSPPINV